MDADIAGILGLKNSPFALLYKHTFWMKVTVGQLDEYIGKQRLASQLMLVFFLSFYFINLIA